VCVIYVVEQNLQVSLTYVYQSPTDLKHRLRILTQLLLGVIHNHNPWQARFKTTRKTIQNKQQGRKYRKTGESRKSGRRLEPKEERKESAQKCSAAQDFARVTE